MKFPNRFKWNLRWAPVAAAMALCSVGSQAQIFHASFDDLLTPPATNAHMGLPWANGGSAFYQDAVWDSRFSVFGDMYKLAPSAPLFGIPHSGSYAVSNSNAADGLMITTGNTLLGAWFSQNEYYGWDRGANSITVNAMNGAFVLGSASMNLTSTTPSFLDTSAFSSLVGITGYRIDRTTPPGRPFNGNWVADDFVFSASVPEPGPMAMMAGMGVSGLGMLLRRRRTSKRQA